jgi:putative NADH-flavin reductase
MVITVFGATGQVGKHIVELALAQGDKVIAFGRNVESLIDKDLQQENLETIKGYVFNEADVFDAVKNADAVISVLGGDVSGADKTRSHGMKNIITQMEKAGVKRIIALGGLGILNKDEDSLRIDDPSYPAEYLPVGMEHLQAFRYLEKSNLDWTFVCSPDIHNEPATEHFITKANYAPEPNKFYINAGDLAFFMLNESKKNSFIKQRVGISNS